MPLHALYKQHGCAVSFVCRDAEQRAAVWIPLGAMLQAYDALKKKGVTDEQRVEYLLWVQVCVYVGVYGWSCMCRVTCVVDVYC